MTEVSFVIKYSMHSNKLITYSPAPCQSNNTKFRGYISRQKERRVNTWKKYSSYPIQAFFLQLNIQFPNSVYHATTAHSNRYNNKKVKKVNVSQSLIAVGAVGVRVPPYLGHG